MSHLQTLSRLSLSGHSRIGRHTDPGMILASCNNTQQTADPAAQATISALATSNAQLSTQVAGLSAAAGVATPTPPAAQAAADPVLCAGYG